MKINEIITEATKDSIKDFRDLKQFAPEIKKRYQSDLANGVTNTMNQFRNYGPTVIRKSSKLPGQSNQAVTEPSNQSVTKTPKVHTIRKDGVNVDKKYTVPELDRLLVNLNKLRNETNKLVAYIVASPDIHLSNKEKNELYPMTPEQEKSELYNPKLSQGQRYEGLIKSYNNHNNGLISFIKSKGL